MKLINLMALRNYKLRNKNNKSTKNAHTFFTRKAKRLMTLKAEYFQQKKRQKEKNVQAC